MGKRRSTVKRSERMAVNMACVTVLVLVGTKLLSHGTHDEAASNYVLMSKGTGALPVMYAGNFG